MHKLMKELGRYNQTTTEIIGIALFVDPIKEKTKFTSFFNCCNYSLIWIDFCN